MDEQTLGKIFDPFFTTKRHGEGTGLALPTVYGLVKQHAGQLVVHSQPGAGTVFEVFLPRIHENRSHTVPAPKLDALDTPVGRGELVVEDDDAVRALVQEALGREGYRIVSASGPTEALSIASGLGTELDLLISDVIMPGMNGRELFAELARRQPTLPVLYISGYPWNALGATACSLQASNCFGSRSRSTRYVARRASCSPSTARPAQFERSKARAV